MNEELENTETEKTPKAYAAIADFFNAWSLPLAKNFLRKILVSSMDMKPTKMNPSTVLFFFKTLKGLLNGALTIDEKRLYRKEAIVEISGEELPDLDDYARYFGWHLPSHAWRFVPRTLSAKEYANPYKLFEKLSRFADKEKWKFILNELQDFTFYKASFAECGEEFNILTIYRLLDKTIEAAHLIEVRAIKEVNGRKRLKWPLKEAGGNEKNILGKTIHDFFSKWKAEEIERDLLLMLKAYLTSPEYISTEKERSNAIFNYETLTGFLKTLKQHALK